MEAAVFQLIAQPMQCKGPHIALEKNVIIVRKWDTTKANAMNLWDIQQIDQ